MENNQLSFFNNTKGKKRTIEISLDKLFLALIFLIIIIITTFALGVEKGKKLIDKEPLITKAPSTNILISQEQEKEKIIEETKEIKEIEDIQPVQNDKTLQKKSFYTIQIASYLNLKTDASVYHIKKLKEQGYKPFLRKKGKYTVLYVGEYDNKEEAKKASNRLRKTYNGCIIRELDNS